MDDSLDPLPVRQLVSWCSGRVLGRDARNRRVPLLFRAFDDLLALPAPLVTVAGTSGKGSVSTLLAAALTADGHVAGLFTSPHLRSFCERIKIDGRDVSPEVLARNIERVFPRLERFVEDHGPEFHPSILESLVIAAASIFQERGATAAVFEAGIGGANDVTSFLPATLSIVASVGLDHQAELGHTVEEIARDKAGIAPPGGALIIGAGTTPVAAEAIERESRRRGVRCRHARADVCDVSKSGIEGHVVRIRDGLAPEELVLPLAGDHQVLNLATVWSAVEALHQLGHVARMGSIAGVRNARIPGRFERAPGTPGTPTWILDVAHNTLSMEKLVATAARFLDRESLVAMVGATEPHDFSGFIPLLFPVVSRIAYCGGFHRAVPAARLADMNPGAMPMVGAFENPSDAVDRILADPSLRDKTILVTGSLFLVGACRTILEQRGLLKADG